MPKFEFRLEALRGVRRAEQQECRARLAESLAVEQVLAGRLHDVQRTIAEHRALARPGAAPGALDVAQLAQGAHYETGLRRQADELRRLQGEANAQVDERRRELVEADRQCKAVELLRERQLAAHLATERRHEQQQLDEAAARTSGGNRDA